MIAAHASFGEGHPNTFAMIQHVQPIPHVGTVAVNGERFAFQGVQNHQRDELFGKLERTVIVGTVGGDHGKSIGVVIGANKMIRSGLGGGIRTVRRVGSGFTERRGVGSK